MLNQNYYKQIREQYFKKEKDYSELFKKICFVANRIGLNRSLKYLERCVIEKKLIWLDNNLKFILKTNHPLDDVINIFYGKYLNIFFPKDGIIIKKTKSELVTRCWNRCPVLEVCLKYQLDTKIICKKVYHSWVNLFLKQINPNLTFYRNYRHIRPHTPYCEEKFILKR